MQMHQIKLDHASVMASKKMLKSSLTRNDSVHLRQLPRSSNRTSASPGHIADVILQKPMEAIYSP